MNEIVIGIIIIVAILCFVLLYFVKKIKNNKYNSSLSKTFGNKSVYTNEYDEIDITKGMVFDKTTNRYVEQHKLSDDAIMEMFCNTHN